MKTNEAYTGEVQQAIYLAGEMAGIVSRLDADALEKWLDTKPEGFNYERTCRAAIAFKRAIEALQK